jgi:hypothetical protein
MQAAAVPSRDRVGPVVTRGRTQFIKGPKQTIRTERSAAIMSMLRSLRDMKGFPVVSGDEEIGHLQGTYYSDEPWGVRYFVVDTGGWLRGRRVLVSPHAVTEVTAQTVKTNLSREAIQRSPGAEAALPVSRRYEIELHDHYAWPHYWGGQPFVNTIPIPPAESAVSPQKRIEAARKSEGEDIEARYDPHLRNAESLWTYDVITRDGKTGHVADLIGEDATWAIPYVVIEMRAVLQGKRMLIESGSIREIGAESKAVRIDLTAEQLDALPEFDPSTPINRREEERLYDYHGQPRGWARELR